jgi:uncharacterized protein (TIGR02246 family)
VEDVAEEVRAVERERLRALIAGDLERAGELHADDFRLITPTGAELSRERYLGEVASGELHYLVWEPGPIEVRVYADGAAAAIRYRSELEMEAGGDPVPRRPYWHTDLYERRDGRWQVVWSHATRIA